MSTFMTFAAELAAANTAFFDKAEISAVEHGNRREAALCNGIVALAAELGVTLKPPLRIDARGEISVVAESGTFGVEFSELLNKHCHPRTGVAPTAIMRDWDSWCRVNHFEVERLVQAYAGTK